MAEIQQLQRKISQQVLERAEADPEWRRQFIEDQETAMGAIPEARQIREMYESAKEPAEHPAEGTTMPATTTAKEEYQQLQRSLTEKMLDKAANDPQWKQQLLEDSAAAMQQANFPELQQIQQMRHEEEEAAEVRGQYGQTGGFGIGGQASMGGAGCSYICINFTKYWCWTCAYA